MSMGYSPLRRWLRVRRADWFAVRYRASSVFLTVDTFGLDGWHTSQWIRTDGETGQPPVTGPVQLRVVAGGRAG